MADPAYAPLKDLFDAARFRSVADDVARVHPGFDKARFLELTLPVLESLPLLRRMRLMTTGLHATLPADYEDALAVLRRLAPHVGHGFVGVMLCDYVGVYGRKHFAASMDALKFFTAFGSAEFAIREFLRDDLSRTLAVMEKWALDPDEHVRRLASEGSRPRLPWSFRLGALIGDPSPVWPILESLRDDPSLYVRKSVANHLNDIAKDHPNLVLDRLTTWPLGQPRTAWIAKRGLRTLIKEGNARALGLVGISGPANVAVEKFAITPARLRLGGSAEFTLELKSLAPAAQRLVIDYAVHYVKRSGGSSAKVFKWKEVVLGPGATLRFVKRQTFRDFTTRVHHPGRHKVEVLVNGAPLAVGEFELART